MPNYKYKISYLGQSRHKKFKEIDSSRFIVVDPGGDIAPIAKAAKLQSNGHITFGSFFLVMSHDEKLNKVKVSPMQPQIATYPGYEGKLETLKERGHQLIYDTKEDILCINKIPNDVPAKEIAHYMTVGKIPRSDKYVY
jgi:hypothetical protein